MTMSMEDLIGSSLIRNIVCEHNLSADLFTGPDPSYHDHDVYEIFFFIRGNTRLYVEQRCFELKSGDCIVIRPGQMHRCIVTDTTPYERISLYLAPESLRMLSSEMTDFLEYFHQKICGEKGGTIHVTTYEARQYVRMTDRYLEMTDSGKFGNDLMRIYYLTELLLFTCQLFQHSNEWEHDDIMPSLVSSTMQYVKEHMTEDISLASMSRDLNYSSNYISLQFKRHTGLSLREYILGQKIGRAKELLAAGSSVSQAGEEAGFSDYSNFIRSFKKQVGMPPGQYKKNLT